MAEQLGKFVTPKLAAAPGSPVAGQLYYNTAENILYYYNGTTWISAKGEKGEKGEAGSGGSVGDYKESVRVVAMFSITIATELNPGDVIDGVTLAEGDRILVTNQVVPKENGIWVCKASPERATDADSAGDLSGGALVYVEEGTKWGDQQFRLVTNGPITIGTTEMQWRIMDMVTATELQLRVVRGRIDTTTPTIKEGSGFTVAKNATGEVTITFNPVFQERPNVVATPGTSNRTLGHIAEATASTCKLILMIGNTAVATDGSFHFIAVGPRVI